MNQKSTLQVRLFYSYSHKDEKYRADMEKALSFLRRTGGLKEWSDLNIRPGRSISEKIQEEMDRADIVVFLLSSNFIASEECMKEWDKAKQRANGQKLFFRIPIILSECAWRDLLKDDDIKALPKDGKPVDGQESDVVWLEIYEEIKSAIGELRSTFTPKSEFIQKMNETNFIAGGHIKLQDIFIFPRLSADLPEVKKEDGEESGEIIKEFIDNGENLLAKKFAIVHGEDMSGKSALGNQLFVTLAEKGNPVLHIDMDKVSDKPNDDKFCIKYQEEFNGDYSLWRQKEGKTLILDNFSVGKNHIEWLLFAKPEEKKEENLKKKIKFERIIVIMSSDIFESFYMDEERLVAFHQIKIESLTRYQQEQLIRKRLGLSEPSERLTDGRIDEVERSVNSIIISDKICPRYPFFVLSILQTLDGFMPAGMSITSYGHCYNTMIVAFLVKAEINKEDKDINACFNFMEHLALKQYANSKQGEEQNFNFDEFVSEYRVIYNIPESQINKLKRGEYGVIDDDGNFKVPYMHYFFLGRALSGKKHEHKEIIEEMCAKSYARKNFLTLLFVIHHTNDDDIIDNILLHTMCSLDTIVPAKLECDETSLFAKIIESIPDDITLDKPVESVDTVRKEERDQEDAQGNDIDIDINEKDESSNTGVANDLYRIARNNKIMGQILLTKCGSLTKSRIGQIIEVIADGGLRSIKLFIRRDGGIADFAQHVHALCPNLKKDEFEILLQLVCFIWTIERIERVVENIHFPEIKQDLEKVVQEKNTPAYDLIGYFSALDSGDELTGEIQEKLVELLDKHEDTFIQKMLSLRTQMYLRSHLSKEPLEQAICALLGVKYVSGNRRKRRLL